MKKILLIIFIISISLYGQFEKEEPKVSGEIDVVWGNSFKESKVGKNWYEYVVYDNSAKTLTTKVIQTNQNLFKFTYRKEDKYLEYIYLFRINNNGLATNLVPIRIRNAQTNKNKNIELYTDWVITTDNNYARHLYKQEYEMFHKEIDRFGDTNIYKNRFDNHLYSFYDTTDIAYMRKVFNYNKDKEPLTKYQGLIRVDSYYSRNHDIRLIVFSTEISSVDGIGYGYSSSKAIIEAYKDRINSSTNSTHIADLWVVDLFLKIGENFDERWNEIYKSRWQ